MRAAELLVLGSGSSGAFDRNPAGYALRRGGETLLFDLGFGNFRQLRRAGVDPGSVSNAFFTHRHPDHVGDLAALLFHYHYGGLPRGRRLRLHGPRGFAAFVRRLMKAHGPWLAPRGASLSVVELEDGGRAGGEGWEVLCRKVPHSTEALAYRFESREGRFCYSGDTGYDEGLARFAAGVDVFLLECTLSDRERAAGHLRVSEALRLGELSGARRVLLTHLSGSSLAQLRRARTGRARPARDLMVLKLRGSRDILGA